MVDTIMTTSYNHAMPIKAEWIEFKAENIRALSMDLIGVYECGYKRGNRVVYIGKGKIRERLLDHKEKIAFAGVTHFRKRKTTSSEEAKRAETRLINEFCKHNNGNPPKLNTQKPKLRSAKPDWDIW